MVGNGRSSFFLLAGGDFSTAGVVISHSGFQSQCGPRSFTHWVYLNGQIAGLSSLPALQKLVLS